MIEKVILDYLSTTLNLPCSMEVPQNPPKEFIVIEKTSSGRSNYIESSTLAIQSYGESLYDAASISESVKEAMYNSITLDEIVSCRLNSEYNFTDTRMKQYRYQAVFDLVHY